MARIAPLGEEFLVSAMPPRRQAARRCCSSVVEHSIGNGEVDSSILSSSTIKMPNGVNNLLR